MYVYIIRQSIIWLNAIKFEVKLYYLQSPLFQYTTLHTVRQHKISKSN